MTAGSLVFGPFRLDATERRLTRGVDSVPLGSRALDILVVLTERPGEVISQRDILARAWPGMFVEEANVRVHVAALRKALGDGVDGARYITNVPGRGYCFVAPIGGGSPEPRQPDEVLQPPPSRPAQLPQRLERMVGRKETVETLVDMVRDRRFVSIVGPGGMGKTTVAIWVAHLLAEEFQGAAHFVDLATVSESDFVVPTIVSELGAPAVGEDSMAGLLPFIADRRLLLVLDNCEHLIDVVAKIAERLCVAATGLHLLTTSREALRAEGEYVHLLRPLEGPPDTPDLTAQQAMESPAIRLFMDRAAASGYSVELTDEFAPAVGDICKKLDGIALAIELVASRVGTHGIRGTGELLENRFRPLWQGRRTALPRHQTLQAMLDWSFNLLPELDRRVFTRLAVFVGPLTSDGALHVAAIEGVTKAEVTHVLQDLVAKSLLWSADYSGFGSYRLPETTRSYLLEKLAQTKEADIVATRHAEYVVTLLGEEGPNCVANKERALQIGSQLGNIRCSLEWAYSPAGDTVLGTKLAALAVSVLLSLSRLPECRRWSAQAVEALPEEFSGTNDELTLQTHLALTTMFVQGNGAVARAALYRGIELAESLGAARQALHLMGGLHIFLTRLGAFNEALEVAKRCLEASQTFPAEKARVASQWTVGCSYHLLGNQALAQLHCEAGFEAAAPLGDLPYEFFGYDHRIRALIVMARTLWLRGDAERATVFGHRAIQFAESGEQPVSLCIALIYTSTMLLWNREFDAARELVNRLVAHATKLSLVPYLAVGMALTGEVQAATGDLTGGLALMEQALATMQTEQHLVLAAGTIRGLADVMVQLGRQDEAAKLLDSALQKGCGVDGHHAVDWADLLRARAEAELARPQPDIDFAEKKFLHSIEVARNQSALAWELRAAIGLANLRILRGQHETAFIVLEEAVSKFGFPLTTCDLGVAVEMLTQRKRPAPRPPTINPKRRPTLSI